MALKERTKRKYIESAVKFLPPDGAQPLDYALAAASSMPPQRLGLVVLGGWLVVTVALSLALQSPVIIGALLVLLVFYALKKPRGLIVTSHGVGLMSTSFFNGRADSLLGLDNAASLNQIVQRQGGSTRIQVAGQPVWVKESDRQRLQRVAV